MFVIVNRVIRIDLFIFFYWSVMIKSAVRFCPTDNLPTVSHTPLQDAEFAVEVGVLHLLLHSPHLDMTDGGNNGYFSCFMKQAWCITCIVLEIKLDAI